MSPLSSAMRRLWLRVQAATLKRVRIQRPPVQKPRRAPIEPMEGRRVFSGVTLDTVGTLGAPGNAYGIAVSGNHAYVADGASSLVEVNISNPADPYLVGTSDAPGCAREVAVLGSGARVIAGPGTTM